MYIHTVLEVLRSPLRADAGRDLAEKIPAVVALRRKGSCRVGVQQEWAPGDLDKQTSNPTYTIHTYTHATITMQLIITRTINIALVFGNIASIRSAISCCIIHACI